MNTHLLISAGAASLVFFLVLLATALWKDLKNLRVYVRRHMLRSDNSRDRRTFSRMRQLESWSGDLEETWLRFR